jgi:hypothetical protein
MSLDTFEQSLLGELRQHVAARTPARPEPRRVWTTRLGVAGAAAAAVAAVAVAVGLVTSVAAPTAAYAVEAQPDGDVVVTVYDFSDASGLQSALAAQGVRADVSYRPDASQPDGQARTSTHGDDAACDIALSKVDGGLRFTLGAAQIAGGSELDIVTSGSSPADVGSPVEVTWSGGSC